MKKINNEIAYAAVMAKIDGLIADGGDHIAKAQFRELAITAQSYEQRKYVVEAPITLTGMIEMRMYEMRLKQKDLAKRLKVVNQNFQ